MRMMCVRKKIKYVPKEKILIFSWDKTTKIFVALQHVLLTMYCCLWSLIKKSMPVCNHYHAEIAWNSCRCAGYHAHTWCAPTDVTAHFGGRWKIRAASRPSNGARSCQQTEARTIPDGDLAAVLRQAGYENNVQLNVLLSLASLLSSGAGTQASECRPFA